MLKRLRTLLQIVFGVVAVGFLIWAIAKNWGPMVRELGVIAWPLVVLSCAAIACGLYVNMLSWRAVVRALGTNLSRREAASVFFTSQLGKYIPGGIWPVVASARLGSAFGLSAITSVSSMTISLLMSATVGLVYGVGVLFTIPALVHNYWYLLILLLVGGLIVLVPPVLNRVIMLALRLLRRAGALPRLDGTAFAAAVGWTLLSWLFLGLGLAFLAIGTDGGSPRVLLDGVSGYALAWVAGFVAIIAPAGVGVREAVLVFVLGPSLGQNAVLGIAVVDRLFMTLGDIAMLFFTIGGRRRARQKNDPRLQVTYVTRKFPPSVGGMETLAFNTDLALTSAFGHSGLIAQRGSNKNLLWWVPATAVRLVGRSIAGSDDVYLFGDALAWATLGWIPRLFRRRALTMVCGLDITYTNPLYRLVVHSALRRAPKVLAISRATLQQAVEAGVDPARGQVVTMGIELASAISDDRVEARREVLAAHALPDDAVVLMTTGRLVKRKGVQWFVQNVMPLLPETFHYLVAGSGPDHDGILSDAQRLGLADRVHLLGYVSDADRELLLSGADFFVQPNIPVPGDMEGFGLVVIESAQAGLLTVASGIEGLQDAVRPGVTGLQAPSGDGPAWAELLVETAGRPDRAALALRFRDEARRIYSLQTMGSELETTIVEVAPPRALARASAGVALADA
ncbi:glycosyltransferase [Frondihabitans australicus]|uniref:Glycosyltransferase involved in cell wall biosynthesis n=1 Tax=Frondihabitans australicus TaxID=386892 RepID=A0A495ICP4_9MICO|nr:glycosyltransferase [Frondihabitans australicus]RKR73238.1 glycosyltransferase involved in cell wall biosynthesis [Frondihabitans australicus]